MADNLPNRPDLKPFAGVSQGRDITRPFAEALLRPQDAVLVSRGQGNLEIWEKVLADPQVRACLQQRVRAVCSKEWEVLPGGEKLADRKAAQFLEAVLEKIDFDGVTEKMLFCGLFYGYSVAEALWASTSGLVDLADLRVRDPKRFRFAPDLTLRLLTQNNQWEGEAVPPAKFWIFSSGAFHSDDPYGRGLASWLYWPVFFKNNGLRFWNIFVERFATGIPIGEFPPGTSEEDRNTLLQTLAALQTDAAAIYPQGMHIKLLEATRSGTADYATLHDTMDAAIAKVILSQTMTTDSGSSLSQAQVHQAVADDVVKADADLICKSFNNSIAKWLTFWNFPGAATPQVWRRLEEEEDLNARAERDTKLFAMGWELTERGFATAYGEGYQRIAPAPAPATAATNNDEAEFAASEPIPDQLATRLREAGAESLEGWVGAMEAELAKADSLEDFAGRLLALYPDLPTEDLQRLLGEALLVARVAGRWQAS